MIRRPPICTRKDTLLPDTPLFRAFGGQYGSCLDGLGARIGDKSSIGAFDALDDSIGQFGTVANCMLTHTRQQIRARYSVWKSKEVMCRWDSGRPARPRIDDQRSSDRKSTRLNSSH